MREYVASIVSSLVCVWLVPITAAAQKASDYSFPLLNVEVSIGGEQQMPSLLPLTISKLQCEGAVDDGADSTKIKFAFNYLRTSAAIDAQLMELWLGQPGQDCWTPDARAMTSTGTLCTKIARTQRNIDVVREVFTLHASELFASPGQQACDRRGRWDLYVVPLVNDTPNEIGSVPDTGLGEPRIFHFDVDVDAPAPAAGLTATSGQITGQLSWQGTLPDSEHHFVVYLNPNDVRLANPGPCGSSYLNEGQPLPGGASSLPVFETQDTTLSVDLAAAGLLPGEKMPAVVVVRDRAGNESVASNVVCLERAYYEKPYHAAPAPDSCFDDCTLRPGRTGGGISWAWGFTLLAFVARRRYRGTDLRLRRLRVRKSS
ncbi:MAG: hypothetical protein QM778_22700 [Myxococcales bacterium]